MPFGVPRWTTRGNHSLEPRDGFVRCDVGESGGPGGQAEGRNFGYQLFLKTIF